jgi:hypothetical protein
MQTETKQERDSGPAAGGGPFRGRRCAICLLRGCGEQASDGGKDKKARGRDGPAVEVLGVQGTLRCEI